MIVLAIERLQFMDTVARVKCDIAQKGGISVNTTSEDRRQNDIEIIDDMLKDADSEEVYLVKVFVQGYLGE